MTADLRSYQTEGVRFLLAGDARLLADDMGLGKTVQVAVALRQLRQSGALRRALIVVPASLMTNWAAELRKFGPSCAVRTTADLDDLERSWLYRLPVPITITGYETLRNDFLPIPPASNFDVLIFDEAQRLKNRDSITTIAARRVVSQRRWLLSATPLENGVGDLASLAEVMGVLPGADAVVADPHVTASALDGNFLRRRKADVLPELPPVIEQDLPLRLAGTQAREYEDEASHIEWSGSLSEILALITRLKLICNRASDGSSAKLEALRVLLDDPGAANAKVIVVSQYTSTLDWLAGQIRVATFMFSGDLSQGQREDALGRFRASSGPAVLLLSLKAGGVGLNIQEASHVVLFDRWWTPAAENQAVARAHRFGRKDPLLVYRFRVLDTVEDRIVEIAGRKAALFEALVEDRLSEQALVERWSRRDLMTVLGLPGGPTVSDTGGD